MTTRPKSTNEEIEKKVAGACKRIVRVKSSQPPPGPVILNLVVKEQPKPDPIIMRMTVKTRVEPPRPTIHYHVVTSKMAKGGKRK